MVVLHRHKLEFKLLKTGLLFGVCSGTLKLSRRQGLHCQGNFKGRCFFLRLGGVPFHVSEADNGVILRKVVGAMMLVFKVLHLDYLNFLLDWL